MQKVTHPARHEMALRAAREWSAIPEVVVKTVIRCAPQHPSTQAPPKSGALIVLLVTMKR